MEDKTADEKTIKIEGEEYLIKDEDYKGYHFHRETYFNQYLGEKVTGVSIFKDGKEIFHSLNCNSTNDELIKLYEKISKNRHRRII